MTAQNAVSALSLLFIAGMTWLRTRMHYRRSRERLGLTRAGRIYFAVLLAVMLAGWFAAPALAQALWPGPLATPLLARVVWFLAAYYLFIPVHLGLRRRGVAMFA
jgi:hypothetical protein